MISAVPAVYDTYTKLMLHCDGADNGTVITDEMGHTITRVGDTCTKTAIKKFGTASLYFDGSEDYLSTPSNTDFAFGTGDFTIDFWIYKPAAGTVDWEEILQTSDYNVDKGVLIQFNDLAGGRDRMSAIMGTGTTYETYRMTSSVDIPIAQWVHIAVVRSGVNAYLFQNGTLVASLSNQSGISYLSSTTVYVASSGVGDYVKCYLDEFRVSKGIARWTANFTPPTGPYPL